MPKLTDDAITTELNTHPGWKRTADEIAKQFEFNDFRQSMIFVNKVADLAEAADHHPDITINYNRVTLTLSTHSEGGLTKKDFALASQIEKAL